MKKTKVELTPEEADYILERVLGLGNDEVGESIKEKIEEGKKYVRILVRNGEFILENGSKENLWEKR